MYIGQVRKVEKRKPARCDHCKDEIPAGAACFVVIRNAKSKKGKAEQERSERELARMKDVIVEITAENLDLKKTLSD